MPPPHNDDAGSPHGTGDMGETGIGAHRKATATDDDPALPDCSGAAEVKSSNAGRVKIDLVDGVIFFRTKGDDGKPLFPTDISQGRSVLVVPFDAVLGAGEKNDSFFRDEELLLEELVHEGNIVGEHPERKFQFPCLYSDPGEEIARSSPVSPKPEGNLSRYFSS